MKKIPFTEGTINIAGRRMDPGLIITLFLSLAFFLFFFRSCVFRYHTFQYHDWDLALYANGMWNLVHGHPFISICSKHLLENHFTVIAFLIAPVYFVFRSPLTLLFLKILSLSLVSVPIYLTAKRKFRWQTAAVFALIYLAYPSLIYVTMYEFHFEDFAPLFLAGAFYFLVVNRKTWFFVMSFLAMLCKENIPLVVAAMGLYACLFRPHRRLIGLAVLVSATFYFLLVTLHLHQLFVPDTRIPYVHHYSAYGSDFAGIFRFILTHPGAVIKDLFSTDLKTRFFKDTLSPLFYLPVFSPDILLITAPTVLKNLLSRVTTAHTIYWQYTGAVIPFLIFSLIFAFGRLSKISALIRKHVPLLLALVFLSEIYHSYFFYTRSPLFVRYDNRITPAIRAKRGALKLVPDDASVITTFDFLPQLSQREDIFTFFMLWRHGKHYKTPPRTEYALIDFNDYFVELYFSAAAEKVAEVLSSYTDTRHWKLCYAENDIALFRKSRASDRTITTLLAAAETPAGKKEYLTLDGSMELADFSSRAGEKDGTLHLTFYWRLKKPSSSLYKTFFYVYDGRGDKLFQTHSVGYRFFTPALPPGSVLKEDYWLVLPDNPGRRRVMISMDFLNLTRGKMAEMNIRNKKAVLNSSGKLVIDAAGPVKSGKTNAPL